MKKAFCAVLVLMTIMFSASLAAAQELSSLTGVVTDNTGAVIPGVDVKLVDTKTNANYSAKSNSLGAYTFAKVLPGPGYKLSFSKDGFETLTISNLYIGVGGTSTQNGQMQIGKVTETVEVAGSSQPVTLDTTDATVGNNFDMHMIHELPIAGRDSPTALLALQPGVTSAHASSDDPNSSRDGAVAGARTDQTNVTLDGLDVNDFSTGQTGATVGNAPVDSIQEFREETANPLAASGRGSGGQVQLVTQSGSNSWHGGLYEYHRNTITEANNLFNVLAGVDTPKLIRNQFGAKLGGPVVKDKLFFFFNYQGRRDATEDSVLSIVPLDTFRNGQLGYINNGAGCNQFSRANVDPACISYWNQAQLSATTHDPQGVGADAGLLTFINSRYPHANDLTRGDGINTGGFRFNAANSLSSNNYVGRVDYNLSEKMKLFGRFTILREANGDDVNFAAAFRFPGDPVTHQIVDHSYAYVIGHTWTISPTKVNNFFYGETKSVLGFPTLFNPTGADYFQTFGPLSAPFSDQQSQARKIPVPVFRDDFTYVKGKHNFQMGGTFKPIKTSSTQVNDFNFLALGLGGHLTTLDPAHRPSDILVSTGGVNDPDPQSVGVTSFDSAFPFMLGRYSSINTNFNNDASLNVLPNGTGHTRDYRYYETEAYFQDTWRLRDDFTLTYGMRYQYYSVPYETNGFEAIPDQDAAQFYNGRVPFGLAGDLGNPADPNDSIPLVSYNFGGKANHGAPGLYNSDFKDFAPRLAFAYNPKTEGGFLGKLFGNRKTSIRGGGGLVFDHPTTNALNFIQDQATYIFQSANATLYGFTGNTTASLQSDPRFTDINTIPMPPTAPSVSVPFQPFVDGGEGVGAAAGQDNYAIDRNLKTPYSIIYSLGIQRELPGNFLLEATYFGRSGRRLLAQADAGQVVDFQDPASPGHSLAKDFFGLSKELRTGLDPNTTLVTPQPFFEDFFFPGATQAIAQIFQPLVTRGDLTDTLQSLGIGGLGLHPQFASSVYITNKGYSSYNGLLATLHKRNSHGLQFDLNYTFSHSIDNVSSPANNVFGSGSFFSGGLICDFTNLKACRANSDFDVTHIITGNFIYELPVGRGKQFGSNMPGWANQVIGGWQISGIPSWRTGFAFTTISNAFPISFLNNAPATFNGDQSAIKVKIHDEPGTGIQLFADPNKAINAFAGPLSLQEGGSRNSFRGPGYVNLDLGVAKHFPINERFVIEFRADAFNVFNHVNFGLPSTPIATGVADITDPSSFGNITTAAAPRQMQFALRLDF